MELEHLIRYCYTIILIVFLLLLWTPFRSSSHLKNRQLDSQTHHPCFFNQLCTCSKTYPDFGIVKCANIPFYRIPQAITNSKLFVLHLSNNRLHTISDHFLKTTGLYKLEIVHNPLITLPNEAFSGLERSLWELELKYDQLIEVPSKAMRYLQKLRKLDLTGNEISEIDSETWRGLENSLEELILAENQINSMAGQTFSSLASLLLLDLSNNNIKQLEPNTFSNGPEKLKHLRLSNNLLDVIPYRQIMPLAELRALDLSFNNIQSLSESEQESQPGPANAKSSIKDHKMALDIVNLSYNNIQVLDSDTFYYFEAVNVTIFNGNPLHQINAEAFRGSKIRELYFRNCELTQIASNAFSGLENSLEVIDLSKNNLKNLSNELFHNFNSLQSVSLRENPFLKFNFANFFISNQHSLTELDLLNIRQKGYSIEQIKKLRNIRKLHFSITSKTELIPEIFEDFSIDVNDLKISASTIVTIKNHAFVFIHGLSTLDLSDNEISRIDKNAFVDIGRSLKTLIVSSGLSRTFATLTIDFFRFLTELEYLDLSNNNIQYVSDRTFHFLKHLTVLRLQDNKIEEIVRGTFQGDIHSKLHEIDMSFNAIRKLQQHTFADLACLKTLNLKDNRITSIDRRTFMNLDELTVLSLKGNKISKISKEAFQNIPSLELLDLSFNVMTQFDFSIFDQVGTLSMLKLNLSSNAICRLAATANGLPPNDMAYANGYYINIKILDLSTNNISSISRFFFKPIELSVMEIYLRDNELRNLSREIFGNMPHLQLLDISHNRIYEINFDTFKNSPKLQILNLAFNEIKDLSTEALQGLFDLKIIDLSHNQFKLIPDSLFQTEGFESINLSHNFFSRIPFNSITTSSAATLCHLDLSYNLITYIPSSHAFTKLQSLVILDLSYNNIGLLNDSTFGNIPNLLILDLSGNYEIELKRYGNSFKGIEKSLVKLCLNNVSLISIPDLPLFKLRHLSLVNNALPTIPPEISTNLTSLRYLDLSFNDLTAVPIVIHTLRNLRTLVLRNNPISSISNHSFLGLSETLISLDIQKLMLTSFENGAMFSLSSLRVLKISMNKFLATLNFPEITEHNYALRSLEINVDHGVKLSEKNFEGQYPHKLNSIKFDGSGIDKIPDNSLKGLHGPELHFTLRDTTVKELKKVIFKSSTRLENVTVDLRNNRLLVFESLLVGKTTLEQKSPFLIDLKIANNPWTCDCGIGWVEFWHRKKRYMFEKHGSGNTLTAAAAAAADDDDLRETRCVNRGNISLIEILKVDLECGWGRAVRNSYLSSKLMLSLIFIVFYFFDFASFFS